MWFRRSRNEVPGWVFEAPPNALVVVERRVWNDEVRLDWVCHDDEGDWTVHGPPGAELGLEDYLTVCLRDVVGRWPEVAELRLMKRGHGAIRCAEHGWEFVLPGDAEADRP